mmetsp:Transcript_17403/g.31744  ORF Transcript_17403/g.31744 Transcript_17403/m.31744 type:complete len:270 (-) Transcript_17403:487-1296(-)
MCPPACAKRWHEAPTTNVQSASETDTAPAQPEAIGMFVARERVLQESLEACRMKQVSTEQEHLRSLKRLEERVAAADTLAMQLEVQRMNLQAHAKREAEAHVAVEVADQKARLAHAETEKVALERDVQFLKERIDALEEKFCLTAKATERRISSSLKRQAALKTSLTAALKLSLGKEEAFGSPAPTAAASDNASEELATMIRGMLTQLGGVLNQDGNAEGKTCCVCMDKPSEVVLLPCKHLSMCAECSESVSRCPLCRVEICERLKVYG